MNKTSTDKIRSAALFLVWFRRTLPTQVQVETRRYLDQPYQLALNIVDCCSENQPIGVKEIAQMVGVTRETVRQVLQALREGGMAFFVSPVQGWQYLDRPSTLENEPAATPAAAKQVDRWAASGWTELAAAATTTATTTATATMTLGRSIESIPEVSIRSTPKDLSVSPSASRLVTRGDECVSTHFLD